MTAYLRDRKWPNQDDLPFPLDLTRLDGYWDQEPILIVEFSPAETTQILAALESARKGRWDEASVDVTLYISHDIHVFKDGGVSHSLDAGSYKIKAHEPFFDAIKETLPNEWVMFEYRHNYWQATHSNAVK